ARLAVRHDVDVVLPFAPCAQAGGAFRHAALAGPVVHRPGKIRERRHRFLPHSDRARGRGWNPSRGLTRAAFAGKRHEISQTRKCSIASDAGLLCPSRKDGTDRRFGLWYKRGRSMLHRSIFRRPTMSLLGTVAAAHRGGAIAAKTHGKGAGAAFWALTVGSIGVVYGDIGTSPLYAMRESVLAAVGPGNPANETAIFGILSLIIWALILIVTLKYVVILLRADNNGEGGTLALMALAQRSLAKRAGAAIVLCGVISAALFYGDAMITPALSVLSAIEGI